MKTNFTINFVREENNTFLINGNADTSMSHGLNDNNYRTMILSGIYSFIFILGTFGNLLVVIATKKFVNLRKPTNILICNLCICDILILAIGIPMFVIGEDKISHIVTCKTLSPLLITFLTATVLSLVTIALERYFAIIHHFKKHYFTVDRAYIVVVVLDIVSFLTGVPLCISLTVIDDHCISNWSYLGMMVYRMSLFMLQYILPLMVMSYIYSRSWQRIRRKNYTSIRLANSNRSSTRRSQEDGVEDEKDGVEDEKNFKCITKSFSNNHLSGIENQPLNRTKSMESIRSENGRLSRRGSLRESFRGSLLRVNRTVTSIVTGADNEFVPTSFVLHRSRQTIATLKIFTYIVVLFAVCMLPHHVIDLLQVTDSEIFIGNSMNVLHIFAFVNAAVNPWVYAGLNIQYRISFRKLFNYSNYRVSNLVHENLIRSPSMICVEHRNIAREETSEITERRGRSNSCPSNRTPMRYRKESEISKASRKDSMDPESDIPICLPIIMVSNYDDEMGDDNYFNVEFWYRDISVIP